MKIDVVFFIGPQGSGKGTQAKLLSQKLGLFYFEMGAILRREALEDTELGKKIAELINKGFLLNDEDLFKVFVDEMGTVPAGEGILFDGVPRTLNQAQFVLDFLKQKGHENFVTVYLTLPEEDSVQRLLLRAHHEFREDDTEDGIRQRLHLYQKDTMPVLEFLKTRSTFYEIDGRPPIDIVTHEINEALGLADD